MTIPRGHRQVLGGRFVDLLWLVSWFGLGSAVFGLKGVVFGLEAFGRVGLCCELLWLAVF